MSLEDELRELRLYIEALERAIYDANEALKIYEGVDLGYYMENDECWTGSLLVVKDVLEP